MTHSENIAELGAALAATQAELDPAVKDSRNPHLGNRYADLAACWDALKAVLPKHGLSVVQAGTMVDGHAVLSTMLVHSSGQWIRGITPLAYGEHRGLTPMQCLGSAWTYARRYGLAAITGLTAEDSDAADSGHRAPERQPSRSTKKPMPPVHTAPPFPAPTEEIPHMGDVPASKSVPEKAPKPKHEPNTEAQLDNVVTGEIDDFSFQDGSSAKGPWRRFGIRIGGEWYGTFSRTVGDAAETLHQDRDVVSLTWRQDGKYKTAVSVAKASESEQSSPANDTTGDNETAAPF